jgi:ribosomal protein L32
MQKGEIEPKDKKRAALLPHRSHIKTVQNSISQDNHSGEFKLPHELH